MAGDRLEVLDEEGLALHRSTAAVARLALTTGLLAFIVWLLVSSLRGLVNASLERLVELGQVGAGWQGSAAMIVVVAVAASVRAVLMRRPSFRLTVGDGVALARDRISAAAVDGWRASLGLALRKAGATLLTLGGGGSGGLEAPVVLIGESLGAGVAAVLRLTDRGAIRLAQLCGVSAAVSTLLGAPFTAALFTMELLYGERVVYRKLAFALWAAVIPFWLNTTLNGYRPLFVAPLHAPVYSLPEYAGAALVAIAVAVPLSFGFGRAMRWSTRLVNRVQPGWHALTTMVVVAFVALALERGLGVDLRHVLGAGEETIRLVLHNEAAITVWWMLVVLIVAKAVTVGLTLSGGGSAGLLFPSMYLGGLAGGLVAQALTMTGVARLDPALFAVVGIASSLTAVVGVPVAAMALVFEVFGKAFGPPTILACGVTYLVTLRFRLWENERTSIS